MPDKAPWQEELVDTSKRRSRKLNKDILGVQSFSVLLTIFIVIILAIIFIMIYTSIGGTTDKESRTAGFYNGETTVQTVATETSTSEAAQTSENSSPKVEDGEKTTVVQPNEGAGQIAARVGISVEQLYALNPSHMSTGSWFAHPGDVIYIAE